MNSDQLSRLTSLGRPLDPSWPTNKAVLILVPLAAVAGFAWFFVQGSQAVGDGATGLSAAVSQSVIFALAVFGCWALGRELLPDDQVAAFVSMAFGFFVCLFVDPGLMLLFITLFLVRMVNRSTGLAARTSDSIGLTLLLIGAVYVTSSPWLAAVGALAFSLDGILHQPRRKQWIFALVCAGTLIVYLVDHDGSISPFGVPNSLPEWLTVMALVLFSLNLILLRKVHSRGDVGSKKLHIDRVKGGMAIGILVALQGLNDINDVVLLVATITGLCFGIAFRPGFSQPGKRVAVWVVKSWCEFRVSEEAPRLCSQKRDNYT